MPKGVPVKQYNGEFKQKVVEGMRDLAIWLNSYVIQDDIPSLEPA